MVVVRPMADYMMEMYHSMRTDLQDPSVKRLHTHAPCCIFCPDISVRKMRDISDLSTLQERHIKQCDKFAWKCVASKRFGHWFPAMLENNDQ